MEIQICAPHPALLFSRETTDLLAAIAEAPVTAVGPEGATSLEQIVDAIEDRRQSLGVKRWIIWGMSGGSFVGQLYARKYKEATLGLILASSGPYFRRTVEDPDCLLCPRGKAWFTRLSAAGLLEGRYDEGPTAWELVDGVGWVFRREAGAALLVSPERPSADLQRIMPALWSFDSRPWIAKVASPTLVMCGTADPIVPLVHAQALAGLLPTAHFLAIENAGHIPITDHRAEVEAAVRQFLCNLER